MLMEGTLASSVLGAAVDDVGEPRISIGICMQTLMIRCFQMMMMLI